jgi:uncharacterized protein YjbI with pentapeptide repeats
MANFSGAQFHNCMLKRVNFGEAVLEDAEMSDAVLDASDWIGAKASRIALRHAKLNNANMTGSDLSNSDCSFAEMRCLLIHADLSGANLYGVDFSGADLSQANLQNANMTGAKILGAKFAYAKMQGSISTNGKPWGANAPTAKAGDKRSWWQIWRAAI